MIFNPTADVEERSIKQPNPPYLGGCEMSLKHGIPALVAVNINENMRIRKCSVRDISPPKPENRV